MCKRILLIDDDEDEQFFFTEALKEIKAPVKLFFAMGSKEGLQMAKFILPDIVFIDINMPMLNGLECLELIRGSKETEKLSAVIYSTGVDDDLYRNAMIKGAVACIKKQNNIHDLATILKNLLFYHESQALS
jgi:CheY-like chemotaxis protein